MSQPLAQQPLFLPYQRRWIEDRSPIKIMEKSRQVGISWATAYNCVRRSCTTGQHHDTWVASRDAVQAKLFLNDCQLFAEAIHLATPTLESNQRNHSERLTLANRTQIHSLTSSPDAQAGKRGHRVLDEFALHTNPRQLYSIAQPGTTWGGQLEIISTHRGAHNYFNSLVNEARHGDNRKGISLHRVTLEDALEDGFLERLQSRLPVDDPRQEMDRGDYFNSVRQSCADEESFQQEYCCQPADDQTAFLSWDLIRAAEYAEEEKWELRLSPTNRISGFQREGATYYLGVDIGRDNDLTVFWLIEKLNDFTFSRKVTCLAQEPFDQQEAVLHKFLKLKGLRRVCIDQTGIGRQFTERARQRYGKYLIEGITFTAATKEALAYPLRSAFEARRIRIPGDKEIRADLRSVKKQTTQAGNVRLAASRSAFGHGDRFWALALALHATNQPTQATHFEPIAPFRHNHR